MKKITLLLTSMVFTIVTCYAQADAFITVWDANKTVGTGVGKVLIPAIDNSTYIVDWEKTEDGSKGSFGQQTGPQVLILPGGSGTYILKMTNLSVNFRFNFEAAGAWTPYTIDREKLLEVRQWGTHQWQVVQNFFRGCSNLEVTATDIPDFSALTSKSLKAMFLGCSNLVWANGSISNWDVSNILSFEAMFHTAEKFNQPLNNWNTESAVILRNVFYGASSFNQPLDKWTTNNVTDMYGTFGEAQDFNQNINNWVTDNVTNLTGTFCISAFNQPLDNWNTENVTSMGLTFLNAKSFNQSLAAWKLNKVGNMANMLDSTALNVANYDATLMAWAADANTPDNLALGALALKYSKTAESAHQTLMFVKGWNITGDELEIDAAVDLAIAERLEIYVEGKDIVVENLQNKDIISLFDISGRCLAVKQAVGGRVIFNLNNAGFYFVKNILQNKSEKIVVK